MAFPLPVGAPGSNIDGNARNKDIEKLIRSMNINNIEKMKDQNWFVTETCMFRAAQSFIFGGLFGIVMGSFTVFATPSSSVVDYDAPMKTQMRQMFTEFKTGTKHWMKIGAIFGGTYSGYECLVDKYRAKHDIYSAGVSGFLTGATVAFRSSRRDMLMGGVGMGLFSMAIEYAMHRWFS